MRCVSITPLLFLATMLLDQITCQLSGRSTCLCLKTSEIVLRKENITSYMIQKAGVCHIDAIVFQTVRNVTFCLNPQKPWVKKAMQFVDKKKKAIKMMALPINSASTSASTFKTTSTLNTTSMLNTTSTMNTSTMNDEHER